MVQKKQNIHQTFMNLAITWADGQSYAERRKVGAIIVKDGCILSQGHNGTISGFDNRCEDSEGNTNTDHILHAESNSILKVAKSNNSTHGATIYTTDAPCIDCAKQIIQSEIKEVYFQRNYRSAGIDLLLTAGITVNHIDENGMVRMWNLLNHHSLFQAGTRSSIVKMDQNIVELFKVLEKTKDNRYGEVELNLKCDIYIKLKPEYQLNPKYTNFKDFISQNSITEDGYFKTVRGLVGYTKKEKQKDIFDLVLPYETDLENKTLHFFTILLESNDRSDYGAKYGSGKIPFSAIESLRIENHVK